MSVLERFCIGIHARQSAEVNTNGRWPSGMDEAKLCVIVALTAGAIWIYGIQILGIG